MPRKSDLTTEALVSYLQNECGEQVVTEQLQQVANLHRLNRLPPRMRKSFLIMPENLWTSLI